MRINIQHLENKKLLTKLVSRIEEEEEDSQPLDLLSIVGGRVGHVMLNPRRTKFGYLEVYYKE
jgi:hypothetical protein